MKKIAKKLSITLGKSKINDQVTAIIIMEFGQILAAATILGALAGLGHNGL